MSVCCLQMAPHSLACVSSSNWDRPYSREHAAFPLVSAIISSLHTLCYNLSVAIKMRNPCVHLPLVVRKKNCKTFFCSETLETTAISFALSDQLSNSWIVFIFKLACNGLHSCINVICTWEVKGKVAHLWHCSPLVLRSLPCSPS